MKKITLAFLMLFAISFTAQAQLLETFDGPDLPTGWTVFDNGIGTAQSWAIIPVDADGAGGYMFVNYEELDNDTDTSEDWLVSPQFTLDAATPILSISHTDLYAEDYLSNYSIRVSTSSQTTPSDFTTVYSFGEGDFNPPAATFGTQYFDLSAYAGQSIYLAFVLEQNNGDAWAISKVETIADADAPEPVMSPTPEDGAVDVAIDTEDTNADGEPDNRVAFAWEAATTGDAATAYNIYLSNPSAADPTELQFLGQTSNTSVNITGIEGNSTYYWMVVAENVGGEAVGSETWSFTTEDNTASVHGPAALDLSYYYNYSIQTLEIEAQEVLENVTVYSLLGQEVLKSNLEGNSASVDVSSLKTGIYLAKLSVNGKTATIKFVKK